MGWYRDLKAILEGEPEIWLAYLHGQQMDNLPLLSAKKPRYRGLLLQIAKFGALLFQGLHLKQPPAIKQSAKFLAFVGTANQIGALSQTIQSLKDRGEELVCIGNPRLLIDKDIAKYYIPCQWTIVDVARSLTLFATQGLSLYRILKSKHPVSVDWHFSNFCQVYIYLAYFYRVLSHVKPQFVITANDHNAPNRCMLAVAHHLGLKTVYLQHASVSSIFPALRLNYAFLDGQCALDTYHQCEPNQPDTARDVPIPLVILSGQKKHLRKSSGLNRNVVGVAFNALDNPKIGIEFINYLTDKGINVRLRWHPAQPPRDTKQYREAFSNNERVLLSDPCREAISGFMAQIGWLVAGNSSIHLEAALSDVMPIYYELTDPDHPDYYGYVKHGLAQPATSVSQVLALIENTRGNHKPNAEAVRYYSSTYSTEWENEEGGLVAECLQRLSEGKTLPVEVVDFSHSIQSCNDPLKTCSGNN